MIRVYRTYLATLFLFLCCFVATAQIKAVKRVQTKLPKKSINLNQKKIPVFESKASTVISLKKTSYKQTLQLQKLNSKTIKNFVGYSSTANNNRLGITLTTKNPIHPKGNLYGGNISSWYPMGDKIRLDAVSNTPSRNSPFIEVRFNQSSDKNYLVTIDVELNTSSPITINHLNGGQLNKYTYNLLYDDDSDDRTISNSQRKIEFIINASNSGTTWFIIAFDLDPNVRNKLYSFSFKSCKIQEINL